MLKDQFMISIIFRLDNCHETVIGQRLGLHLK